MDVDSVYRALQEIFPQVDVRLLRGAAFDHKNDVDAAAETVLRLVRAADERNLPVKTVSPNDQNSSEHVSTFSNAEAKGSDENWDAAPALLNGITHDSLDSEGPKDNKNQLVEHHIFGTNDPEGGHNKSFFDASDSPYNIEFNDTEANVDMWKYRKVNDYMDVDTTACASTSTTTNQVPNDYWTHGKNWNVGSDSHPLLVNLNPDVPVCEQNIPSSGGANTISEPECNPARDLLLQLLNLPVEKEKYTSSMLISDFGSPVDLCPNQDVQPPVNVNNIPESESNPARGLLVQLLNLPVEKEKHTSNVHIPVPVDLSLKQDGVDDSPITNCGKTQSGQVCRIGLLDNIIDEAKSDKERLSAAIEAVTELMRKVELAEKEADQAKQDAARGGVDTYARADELKTMLKHAKEANDMHSGEVYGERAILATEVRELQNRLLGLSVERDKSLSMLYEMQKTLEIRIAAAEQEKTAAEEDKLQKETEARAVLTELDLAMKKVLEESRVLNQEAEENEKLREFLVDRGHVIDVLQGEFSVICQDVKLLKENFDNRRPLMLGYTSCNLASSASSAKSNLASSASSAKSNLASSASSAKSNLASSASSAKSNLASSASSAKSNLASSAVQTAVNRQAESSNYYPEVNATNGQEEVPLEKKVDDKQLSDDDWELFETVS